MKLITLIKVLLLIFYMTSWKVQENKTISSRIYFVPNNYSTYNYGKATYRKEYKDYGRYFDMKNQKTIKKIKNILSNLKKSNGGRNGKRIKVILKEGERIDSIYLSYLPSAKIEYNGNTCTGNPKLFNLIVNEIKDNYRKGNYICEGKECSKNPDKNNVKFLEMMSDNKSN
ncbi:hypothetical protein TPENAI_40046 [Tenacibaculum litopenaei]|uniref:hypothetical protein n=1 Tax=Tenacibaculum litopenaei TaxID=396016 RepID=UPI0038943D68